ncbi:hypothetical protein GCM10027355_01020 [Haloplanus salinarum]|uniref:hypothetical protein n=1 Tax=Haloplanus salinarum TaxID=1912324 RepID=UPI003B43376C
MAFEHIHMDANLDISHISVVRGDSAEAYRQESQFNLAVGDTYLPDYDNVGRQRVTAIFQSPYNSEAWDYELSTIGGEETTTLSPADMAVTEIEQIQIDDKYYRPLQFRR